MSKFKCLACEKKFKGDYEMEHCPYCGSDNITPYSNSSTAIKAVGLFILCFLVGFGGFQMTESLLGSRNRSRHGSSSYETGDSKIEGRYEETDIATVPPISEELVTEAPEEVILAKETNPEIVNVGKPVEKNGKYNFTVQAQVESSDNLSYAIYEIGKDEAKYVSETGVFENLEASKAESGVYLLNVINTRTGDKTEKVIAGFVPVVPQRQPIVKLGQSELQAIFDSGMARSGMGSKFARRYQLHFTGLAEAEPEPDRFEEIFNRLIGAWESVDIIKISYNEWNEITQLYLQVNQ